MFSADLVPETAHSLVRAIPDATPKLLSLKLGSYMHFTERLELQVVTPVTTELVFGKSPFFTIPDSMRDDALKILTDESYHAQFTRDMTRRLVSECPIPLVARGFSSFQLELQARLAHLDKEERALGELFAVAVSETLITQTLTALPKDETVALAIREMAADHARDEARHHAYFSALISEVWPQLPDDQQALLAELVPAFIRAFLEPDESYRRLALERVGLATADVDLVLRDVATADRTSVLHGSRSTIGAFARAGALDRLKHSLSRHGFYS